MSRWYSANVLQAASGSKHLFELHAKGDRFVVNQKQDFLPSEPLPSDVVGKGWRSLFRRKLNLAWLPSDKVFLRAVQLPSSDVAEISSMIELQMEKLSPLPVTHVVWSYQILPKPNAESMQTVVVMIAARTFVEEFLGGLEGSGYLADRLEVSHLDQLIATRVEGDGVWIYASGEGPALIAWWSDGALHNLTLVPLPDGPEKAGTLITQVEQLAWAGELEGWLKAAPRVHLVAEGAEADFWEPVLREWAGQSIEVVAPVSVPDLAALSAKRSAETASSNLLPTEFASRYQQQFVDRLWMRGLFGVLAIYAVGVLAYFAALSVLKMQHQRVAASLQGISGAYTNALQNEARIQILKDRQELKYAALNCWEAVAKCMPNSLTLQEINFQRGRLDLVGTVILDDQIEVTTFNEALRKNESLFTEVSPPTINTRGQSADWRFSCTLRGGEK